MAKKLRVWTGNCDGRFEAAIAAYTQQSAVDALQTSIRHFRDYFEEQEVDDADLAAVVANCGVVYYREMMARPDVPWALSRSESIAAPAARQVALTDSQIDAIAVQFAGAWADAVLSAERREMQALGPASGRPYHFSAQDWRERAAQSADIVRAVAGADAPGIMESVLAGRREDLAKNTGAA